ncbi:LOW QUALITY PROTEIN: probable hexosyltransferase MUCI70 [Elaeis guineensis]|uniref:LOW QUALITY PROTEIN: probable hexosyltransferase MUCI70 n=1 Tax=Elaeis guineensis var. tenera TaxID=51953 RepID=UPI003C6CFD0B
MTGGSLGLRNSGSYGSLQSQLHNGATLPIQSTSCSVSVRKPPKMLLQSSREKERFLPWICKLAGRRKIGMLLLLVASAAVVLSFISAMSKDEDASEGLQTNLGSSYHVRGLKRTGGTALRNFTPPFTPVKENNTEITAIPNQQSASGDSETQPPVPVLPRRTIFIHHPCENFSFPPPTDRKRTGPRPCPVCYIPVEQAMTFMPASPSVSPVLKNLTYVSEETLTVNKTNGGSIFGGHPSLQQRNESFDIRESMIVHCGFVRGKKPGQGTGFDIDDADLLEMEQCRGVVVASAIFGNYDVMQQPRNISEYAKRNACFYMFVDKETEYYIKNTTNLDSIQRVGLWRVVVVRNLPYVDARRNGKVPKLLLHRLFPNARFSLWIDGKLELVVDPYQILERFLWRKNATFAISRHYRRFDVFEEAEANKAAGKYDNASIDFQVEFYMREGLMHYSPAKLPITSDVPEGCVIIREHIPITNLFTCLWFNEVDRFTSRDQLSFSTVRDKIMSKVNWGINMFMDCERRNFVVQAYHRDLLEQRLASLSRQPALVVIHESPGNSIPRNVLAGLAKIPPSRKLPMRRGRDRRSGSRRHRLRGATVRENNLI